MKTLVLPVLFSFLVNTAFHLIAIGLSALTGFGWEKNMVLAAWGIIENPLLGFGFPFWVIYLVWVSVILLLYPFCKNFDRYKMGNKDKCWLSYF